MIGFFIGVPPAMMAALGAAALLITRTLEPKNLYREVDWGLLVFFVGLFIIVGGAENAGIVNKLLDLARHWNLQHMGVFAVVVSVVGKYREQCPGRNAAEIACAGLCRSSYGMADAGDGIDPLRKPDHHRIGRKHHCRREREARCVHQLR